MDRPLQLEEDGDCYDDDGFEDPEAVASVPKPQPHIGADDGDQQVHPLGAFHDAIKLSASVTTTLGSSDGSGSAQGDTSHDADDDDGYSDDEFEGGKLSPTASSTSPSSRTNASTTAAGVTQLCISAAELARSRVDLDGATDADDVATADDASDHKSDSHDRLDHEPAVTHTAGSSVVDLVRIHAHRLDDVAVDPPPVPLLTLRMFTTEQLDIDRQLQRLKLSEQRAVVAAKRVTEYRDAQTRREAQAQADAAVLKKTREQFRASNRKHYDVVGVHRCTGEQRYTELLEEAALLKQHRRACAALERHQRWYNQRAAAAIERAGSPAARTTHAPAHMTQIQTRAQEASRQQHDATIGRAQRIKARQKELQARATALVSACTGITYVRGSHLLTTAERTRTRTRARA